MKNIEELNCDYVMVTISNQEINEAIKRLQVDHIALEQSLQELIKLTQSIVDEQGSICDITTLKKLRGFASAFHREMNEHAAWEEQSLFPMMALYFSKDINQLTLMEQDHVLAEQFIQAFIDSIERAPVRQHDEHCMLSYLNQASNILSEHFATEEDALLTLMDYSSIYGY